MPVIGCVCLKRGLYVVSVVSVVKRRYVSAAVSHRRNTLFTLMQNHIY